MWIVLRELWNVITDSMFRQTVLLVTLAILVALAVGIGYAYLTGADLATFPNWWAQAGFILLADFVIGVAVVGAFMILGSELTVEEGLFTVAVVRAAVLAALFPLALAFVHKLTDSDFVNVLFRQRYNLALALASLSAVWSGLEFLYDLGEAAQTARESAAAPPEAS